MIYHPVVAVLLCCSLLVWLCTLLLCNWQMFWSNFECILLLLMHDNYGNFRLSFTCLPSPIYCFMAAHYLSHWPLQWFSTTVLLLVYQSDICWWSSEEKLRCLFADICCDSFAIILLYSEISVSSLIWMTDTVVECDDKSYRSRNIYICRQIYIA